MRVAAAGAGPGAHFFTVAAIFTLEVFRHVQLLLAEPPHHARGSRGRRRRRAPSGRWRRSWRSTTGGIAVARERAGAGRAAGGPRGARQDGSRHDAHSARGGAAAAGAILFGGVLGSALLMLGLTQVDDLRGVVRNPGDHLCDPVDGGGHGPGQQALCRGLPAVRALVTLPAASARRCGPAFSGRRCRHRRARRSPAAWPPECRARPPRPGASWRRWPAAPTASRGRRRRPW